MNAREVVVKNFNGPGEHLYADMLGWSDEDRRASRSFISREIFRHQIEVVGFNIAFYYVDNDTFYGIHTESLPIEVKVLPRDRTQPYTGWQCEGDTHDDGEVIASFQRREDIWEGLRIANRPFEEVLERSYIITED